MGNELAGEKILKSRPAHTPKTPGNAIRDSSRSSPHEGGIKYAPISAIAHALRYGTAVRERVLFPPALHGAPIGPLAGLPLLVPEALPLHLRLGVLFPRGLGGLLGLRLLLALDLLEGEPPRLPVAGVEEEEDADDGDDGEREQHGGDHPAGLQGVVAELAAGVLVVKADVRRRALHGRERCRRAW